MRYFVTLHGEPIEIELGASRDGRTSARIVRGATKDRTSATSTSRSDPPPSDSSQASNSSEHSLELRPLHGLARIALQLDGACHDVFFEEDARGLHVTIDGTRHSVVIEDERERAAHLAAAHAPQGPMTIRAAMPGIVRAILVQPRQHVAAGQPLVILEAMKMENEVRADHAGVVREVKVFAGTPVDSGAELVVLDPPATPA